MNANITLSDRELRIMRDTVYPATNVKNIQHDESWEMVKKYWREDVEWLRAEYEKVIKGRTRFRTPRSST